MGLKSVFPQVIAFITLMMKGLITSSQVVDSGAVIDYLGGFVARQVAHRQRQCGDQLGQVVDLEVGDHRFALSQAMTGGNRLGSGPNHLPFAAEMSDRVGVHVRHDEGGP